jgi:hypothetical protein
MRTSIALFAALVSAPLAVVGRGTAMFAATNSTVEAPHRVEVISRCADPKAYPSFVEFGRFAGEMVLYQAAGGKGSRPAIRCRT